MSAVIPLLPQYAFMTWCSVKNKNHRDNFILPLVVVVVVVVVVAALFSNKEQKIKLYRSNNP
jgi:hypothetical protein